MSVCLSNRGRNVPNSHTSPNLLPNVNSANFYTSDWSYRGTIRRYTTLCLQMLLSFMPSFFASDQCQKGITRLLLFLKVNFI